MGKEVIVNLESEGKEKILGVERETLVLGGGGAVNSVNGQTGTVVLTTSDLENDSDYQTGSEVEGAISTAIGALTIPTKTSDLTNDGENGTSTYVEADELATVATTGSYSDLTNKPTIPAAQVQSDWTQSDNTKVDYIKNKPTIPTVNDATLTITQNGVSKGTFTANDADDTTIEVSDTTYSAFIGTDGTSAGAAGLVPAPATTDAGKFLKADGTWDTAGGGGPTVVQTTGTSTTDVMSQDATTSMVMEEAKSSVKILANSGGAFNTVAIGKYAEATKPSAIAIGGGALSHQKTVASGINSVAIGHQAKAAQPFSIALGDFAQTTRQGELNIGASSETHGYNNTNYRVIGGVHDPVDAHDAATKGYVDAKAGFFNIENIVQAAYENPDVPQTITLQEYEALEEACMDFLPLAYYHYDGSTYTFVIIPSYDCNPSSDIGVNVDTISYFMGKFSFQYNNGQPYVTYTQV